MTSRFDARQALDRGLGVIGDTYDSMVKRGRLTPAEKERRLALIRGTLDYGDLPQADVIIEAVFEDLELKRRIFRALDDVAKPGAMLATNTSTLDIDAIASATRRPRRRRGTAFLLARERHAAARSGPHRSRPRRASSARALDLGQDAEQDPVLARVCYGFIGNRMMEGYAREAERMVLEGATPRQVDGVLEPGAWPWASSRSSTWRASMSA